MVRDDRLYAFIVARTTRSRARIRRISIHKRWMKVLAACGVVIIIAALYGFYGLTQHLLHLRIERENQALRVENEKQRQQLNNLNQRVEAVEESTRRLAEISGVEHEQQQQQQVSTHGAGGPAVPLDAAKALEDKTMHLEEQLRTYEVALRERAMTPSIWPVTGELTDGFGGRRNPFGGSSTEFHTGQDIATLTGTPVAAAANGTVIFAGCQNGYGQIVIIDHGGGLTTRYGHLSKIEATVGQSISRGEVLGRVGSTGRSTGPHLHYEVRINDEPVDPMPYLPSSMN
ncbi:MAG TPA: peptidoglycan DD-metalloendopeptidase family protein [Pyrinomonadaceae bacterium]|jgi:murein DD-endopeptidase MepM/ murein hydrolase activator NlpD